MTPRRLLPAAAVLAVPLALGGCSGATPAKMAQVRPGMTADQAQAMLGRPASIEASETPDQALNGEVDHYPGSRGEGRVVIVNHVVFQSEFVPAH